MKKHFPSNILEVIAIMGIDMVPYFPLFALNAFFLKLSIEKSAIIANICSSIFALGIYYVVNKKNNIKVRFNFKIDKSIIILSLILLTYLVLISPISHLFHKNFIPSKTRLISIVILTPVFEEIIFRGVILKGLLVSYKPNKSIIISSILFSLEHLIFTNLIGASLNMLWALISGLFLGYVYFKTKSVGMVIILHALNNGLVILENLLQYHVNHHKNSFLTYIYDNFSVYFYCLSLILFAYLINRLISNKVF
ncbi:hypothetical protein BWZ22_06385 [Seonamhaeicola sp. S2-3]|uniref:CPBP family intramembrane glutamic endopeptidase n=1 Tax=Seonamhaeicola sp. S2-3 TaxID=1936081 RepID=UPI000972CA54|nr:CPBP family intramembrane glutamic endopeptidase [Seonamhaeicola sp. S2-3]APY10888.1 hypothetical protein BWZ22_06385 [Seonamhaeicola sp. S2-3]